MVAVRVLVCEGGERAQGGEGEAGGRRARKREEREERTKGEMEEEEGPGWPIGFFFLLLLSSFLFPCSCLPGLLCFLFLSLCSCLFSYPSHR